MEAPDIPIVPSDVKLTPKLVDKNRLGNGISLYTKI